MDWAALAISVLALAASGFAVKYTRAQARASEKSAVAARALLLHETEAHLRFQLRLRFTLPESEQGPGASTDTVWFLENNGKADALSVSIEFEFDPSGIEFGRPMFERVKGGEEVRLEPTRALPGLEKLWLPSKNRTQRATISWRTPAGEQRKKTINTVG